MRDESGRNKMKVLFLRNQLEFVDTGSSSKKLMKNFGTYPPIALCHLAAVGRELGHDVRIIDAFAEKIRYDIMMKMILDYAPDIVCFSLWTHTFKFELKTVDELKRSIPGVRIIVGGPHMDIYAKETMEAYPSIDYAVQGEGEKTFKEMLKALSSSGSYVLNSIDGVIYRASDKIICNPPGQPIKNLDEIPFPAVDLLPLGKYDSIVARNNMAIYLLTARGCPFKCMHCVDQQFGRSVRYHSPDYVIGYIKWLVKGLGINELHFFDDTFTLDKKRVLDICGKIKSEGLSGIPWTIRTRVDTVDDEVLRTMWEAGCYRIGYGVESGNQEILNLMRRGTSIEKIRTAFSLTRGYPFEIAGNFMIGYLGESLATYRDTVDFSIELDPEYANFSITQIILNSDLYYKALELDLIVKDEWPDYISGKIDHVNPGNYIFEGKDYSKKDLKKMQALAYLKFYLRPLKLWQQMKKTRSLTMLLKKVWMMTGMINSYFETIMGRDSG